MKIQMSSDFKEALDEVGSYVTERRGVVQVKVSGQLRHREARSGEGKWAATSQRGVEWFKL